MHPLAIYMSKVKGNFCELNKYASSKSFSISYFTICPVNFFNRIGKSSADFSVNIS